jgi:altronate dehydratase large subunit
MKLTGYRRPDGRMGFRNHLAILPTSVCSSDTAVRISEKVPGSVALPHQHGCCQMGEDYQQMLRTLVGLAANPNVGAVLIVALGCEGIQADSVQQGLAETGKPVSTVIIQENGGTLGTAEVGVRIASEMARSLSQQQRVPCEMSDLVLGLECGGSDPTSGIASNPVVGVASDMLLAEGGRSILSETTELIGAEHILARRARNEDVAQRLYEIVARTESRAVEAGADLRGSQPTPGNIAGGLTTIEEKSLGCIYKAGSAPVEDVLEYAESVPRGGGMYVMDTPGQDIDSITGMVAGGAQLVVFTTGRGTPTGNPIAPVIKVTGNTRTYEKMLDNIDLNAGRVIDDSVSVEQVGRELFAEILDVANGKLTKAESLGHHEFGIFRVGFTY